MTSFYCCERLRNSNLIGRPYNLKLDNNGIRYTETLPYFEICDEFDCEKLDYCPFCGSKLSKLV